MQIDLNLAQLVAGFFLTIVCSVGGSVWWVSQREKQHEFAIYKLSSRLDIFETSYREQKEHQKYLINGLVERIDHKGDRLMSEIKELEKEFKEFKNK